MVTLLIRAVLIYSLILAVFRLMGKRQLGQMQPFELVLTLIIADLATIPMAESAIPVLHGIVPLLTLVTVHFFITILTRKSDMFNRFVSGKPVIVINPNGIDYEALKKLNFSLDDLLESIRGCNFFSFEEVQYAIVETNGKVSILPKRDYAPLTIGDYENTKPNKEPKNAENTTIPITLVSEGKIIKDNLTVAHLDEKFIKWVFEKTNTKKLKDILVLTIDGNGKIYFQKKKGSYKILNSDYKAEVMA